MNTDHLLEMTAQSPVLSSKKAELIWNRYIQPAIMLLLYTHGAKKTPNKKGIRQYLVLVDSLIYKVSMQSTVDFWLNQMKNIFSHSIIFSVCIQRKSKTLLTGLQV